jgi:AraC family transcriptional regulator, transcriptional activator FtrA
VRSDWGPQIANQVARRLVVPAHRQGNQAQYVERPMPRERAGGSRIGLLLDLVRRTLDQDWPVERLATEAATSVRALHRRFRETVGQSPGAWLRLERVAHARELLEASTLPIDDVATACGFRSAATLRHHFRAILGCSPASYRARFTTCAFR